MKGLITFFLFLVVGQAALIGGLIVDNAKLQMQVEKYTYALSDHPVMYNLDINKPMPRIP